MKDAPTIHWTGDRGDLVKKSQGQYSELEAKDGKKKTYMSMAKKAPVHIDVSLVKEPRFMSALEML